MPLWAICFALGMKSQLQGAGILFVGVVAPAEASGRPVLSGRFSPSYRSEPLQDAGLQAGDVVIRLGAVDLRGVGPLRFAALASEQAHPDGEVELVFERGGRRGQASLALLPLSGLRVTLAISLTLGAAVLFLFLRARPTRFTRALFYAGMCSAIYFPIYTATRTEFYVWAAIGTVGITLSLPLLIRAAQLFPHDIPPRTRWDRSWPWCFVVTGAFYVVLLLGEPRIGALGMMGTTGLGLALVLAVATRNYRNSDAIGRRQMKWIVFGAYCAALPVILAVSIALLKPELGWIAVQSWWAYPVSIVFLLVAVIRFNFVDVDRVISVTASYNILLVLLAAAVLVAVPRLAEAASGLAGVSSETSQAVLSLLWRVSWYPPSAGSVPRSSASSSRIATPSTGGSRNSCRRSSNAATPGS